MKEEMYPHLLNEVYRLINEDIDLSHIKTGKYANNWREKNKKKTDLILRIARILAKC